MRSRIVVCLITLALPLLWAQRTRININAETPEGAILQQIGQEEDAQKRMALMEQFIEKFPKHEGVAWVYSQMQPAYIKAGQPDKAMDVTEKLLAIDPADAEMAHEALKAAEAKKDPDAIRKWAVLTSEAARKVVNSPKPSEESEAGAWKQRVDYARQVDTYTDYSLYSAGLQAADPKKRIELLETCFDRSPDSQYGRMATGPLFQLYQATNAKDKALALAEKVLAKDQSNEDMLLVVANHYYDGLKDKQKVLDYAGKAAELAQSKPKPEGVADADWQKARARKLGFADWLIGVVHAADQKWALADKHLRSALPNVKDSRDLHAEALFHLGVANFRVGDASGDKNRILDALKFNQECAALPGTYQALAKKNIAAIRNQYHITK